MVAVGATLAVLLSRPGLNAPRELLTTLGVTPFGVCALGLVLLLAGAVLARSHTTASLVRTVRGRHKRTSRRVRAMASDVSQVLQTLLVQMDRPPASGEELNRVLQALKRQDEKLQSLAKASMTYAKPIAELGTQYKEIAEKTRSLEDVMDELSAKLGSTGDRMETRSREVLTKVDDTLRQLGSELQQAVTRQIDGLGKTMESRGQASTSGPELDRLLRQTQQVAEAVAALGQQIAQGVPVAGGPAAMGAGDGGAPALAADAGARLQAALTPKDEPPKAGGGDVQGAIAKLKKLRGR